MLFLDSSEDDALSSGTRRARQVSTSIYPLHHPSSSSSPENSETFPYHTPAAAAAVRARSVGKDEVAKDPVVKIKDKTKMYIRGDSVPAAKGLAMISLRKFCFVNFCQLFWQSMHMQLID